MPNAFQFRSLLGKPASMVGNDAKPISGRKRAGQKANQSDKDVLETSSRTARSLQIRENLDVLLNQVEHARRDADQMVEEMSALQVDAGLATSLRRENDSLREQLDGQTRETIAEAAKAEGAARELARLKEELARIRSDYEKSEREANANKMDAERIEDRLRTAMATLDETKRDLEMQRQAKDKAEVDAACLRSNLAERDRAQNNLLQQETELRMQSAKLQSQYEDLTEVLTRKERSILEKSSQIESQRDRIADLEIDGEATREELRLLGTKYSDLKVSQDSRLYALNDGLNQERESHQMTRKLLEEARDSNEVLADEISTLKDQSISSTKDQQKDKRELSAARAQLREYGDKLKEAHLRLSAAEGDIQRLEASLEEAKKDASSLRRQASKADQLLRENTDLNDKMASMQDRVHRYRSTDLVDDVPILLSNSGRGNSSQPSKKVAKPRVASSGQNVARIARR